MFTGYWRYLFAWLALALIAVFNGILREASYGQALSELVSHQLSTLSAMLLCAIFVLYLDRIWPFPSARHAWVVGVAWLLMTVAFEFGFGHFIAGHSWGRLLTDYNLTQGRVWSLFLFWVLVLPPLIHRYSIYARTKT